MKKGIVLAALFAIAAFAGGAMGYNQYQVTRYGDLRCTDILLDGNHILDSNGTTRITVGSTVAITGALSTTGAIAATGAISSSGQISTTGQFVVTNSTAPRSATVGVTPSAIGALIFNTTDSEVCIATATNKNAWIELSTSSVVACRH